MFTDATIQGGVDDWDSDVTQATLDYGHISTWDVALVTKMDTLFQGLSTFNDDIGDWDVSGVTTMSDMFNSAALFNQDLSDWDVSGVTTMQGMFAGADSLDQDLSDWDITSVITMENMLDGTAISQANYDSLLVSWSQLSVQPNVTLGATGLVYCSAIEERNSLKDDHGWIFEGDQICVSINDFILAQDMDGDKFHITELLKQAVDYYNEVTDASPPATMLDFARGEVVGDQVHMTVSLQAIIEAIQAGGLD